MRWCDDVHGQGQCRPPGLVTRRALMPGLVMSCCAIQTQALTSPGAGTFYHESVTTTSQAWPGGENMSRLRTGFCEQGVSVVVR